ncbi:MAG TPA: GNAT family N-acetyltransferase [Gammaproteobacteria bacterium]|nr:GNAT family N-acetyltransferase [Gammaproteobacteria bacterium]
MLREWDELAERLQTLPYHQSGWALAWWRAFGHGAPELHTLRRDGRLVALLPMTRHGKVLEALANYHTPAFRLLADDTASASAIAQALFSGAPTHLSLTSLDEDDFTLGACLDAAEQAGYRVVVRPFVRSLYIDVDCSWTGYEAGLGDNLLRNLRRSRRQLAREGHVAVDVITGGPQLDERLREAFLVENAGWKGAAGTSILSDARTQRFYTAIGRWAAERGLLRLFMLRVDRRPLAMCFAIQERGVCHLLKAGYDPAYGRYSPGNLLMQAMIRGCFDERLQRIELNGDTEPYKLSWTRTTREHKRLEAFAPTVAGQLAWASFTYSRPLTSRVRARLGLTPEHCQ